jgi:hypothetical protein
MTALQSDMEGLGMSQMELKTHEPSPPIVSIAKEKIIEQIKREESDEGSMPLLSLVVVGMFTF